MISKTPKPPYYAVIFSSTMSENNKDYINMSKRMIELAAKQDGFLGVESVRDKLGITVSYWLDLDSIKKWKINTEHIEAKTKGKNQWYSSYKVRISKVEMDYSYNNL